MPGMTRFYNMDYLFLIGGFILLTVFLNTQIEYDKNLDVTRCSKFTGSIIIGLCLLPSLILLTIFYMAPLILGRFSLFSTGNIVCFLLSLIFIFLGILMGIRSFHALKHCSKPTIHSAYYLKKTGLQVGLVFFAIGIACTGFTLSFGMIEYSEITYKLSIESTEPTMYYFPLPVTNQDDIPLAINDELSITSGSATWKLNDTEYGKALMIHTNASCQLIARIQTGLKDRNQVNSWFETSSITMKEQPGDNWSIPVFLYASTNNSTIDFRVSLNSNLGTSLDYTIYNKKLDKGWQVVTFDRRISTI
jgi:hypothetical protein